MLVQIYEVTTPAVCTGRTEAIQDQKRPAISDSVINELSAVDPDCRY
jgi:hypothetical protein